MGGRCGWLFASERFVCVQLILFQKQVLYSCVNSQLGKPNFGGQVVKWSRKRTSEWNWLGALVLPPGFITRNGLTSCGLYGRGQDLDSSVLP